jgi:hypothetical protein
MKELENIHADRFYTDLVINGKLIQETVLGTNEDGDSQVFYLFEDAIDEAEEEGFELESYGEAYYYKDGKVYLVTVFLENNEGSGVNELDAKEISELIQKLIEQEPHEGDSDSFYESETWAVDFK